jgi:hypothetical protein
MAQENETLKEKTSSAEAVARVRKVYAEGNSWTGKENLRTLLERVEASNSGFSERICAVLDAKAAVDDLTLRDIIAHATLGHPDERALEYGDGRMDGDIQRIVRTMCKERGVCAACVRAATAGWVAMTVSVDLGLEPYGLTVHESEAGSGAACLRGQQTARTGLATKLRVARLCEEFNHGSKEGPEELHDTAMDLLDQLKESNPGFCGRIAGALTTEDLDEAALGLTLEDIKSHTTMWHLDDRIVGDTAGSDYLWRDIRRVVEAVSKECRVCVSCGRALVARWLARTMAWDLGPKTTPDPLAVPKDGQALPSAAG